MPWLWCYSCTPSIAQNRITAPKLARAPRLSFLETFSSPHQHPRGFFSHPPSPLPYTPSHPLFPKIASHICNRQRSRPPVIFFSLSLSLSMCFSAVDPTVSHHRSPPCNWFYISDKQSTALNGSCLYGRWPAWIVTTLCTEWAWGLFGL